MSMFNIFSQVIVISWANLCAIPKRWGTSVVAILGTACVVGVFIGMLSMAAGFEKTMQAAGSDSTYIVLREDAQSELISTLSNEQALLAAAAPGISKNAEGQAIASAELHMIFKIPKKVNNIDANVSLRGVQSQAYAVRDHFKLIAGRHLVPGQYELMVGRSAQQQFVGLEIGNKIEFARTQWRIVGVFEDGGGVSESEVWCDVRILQQVFERANEYQSLRVKIESEAALVEFNQAIASDPRLHVSIRTEKDYYAEQSEQLSSFIKKVGYPLAILMAIGAIFGSLNTMYASVSARRREIATLRALGFGNSGIVASIFLESLLLALVGSVVGAVVVYIAFNGYTVSTISMSSFSQVVFAFAVTPGLLLQGAVAAIVIGLFGGIFPVIRALRVPVVVALRES